MFLILRSMGRAVTDSTNVWKGMILSLLINEIKASSRDTCSNIFITLKHANIFITIKHANGSKDCLYNRGERQ